VTEGLRAWLVEWLRSGHAIDLILGIVAVEVLLVGAWVRHQGRRIALGQLVGPVGAGVFLMLSLRTALVGGAPELVAALLLAAFPAHLYDLRVRLAQK
jgi:hypothetical protein